MKKFLLSLVLAVVALAGVAPAQAQQLPSASNVLSAFMQTGGTLLTIPANRIWSGTIYVCGVVVVGSGGAASSGAVQISSTGGTPTAAVYLPLYAPSSAASASGTTSSGCLVVPNVVMVAGPSAPVVLTVGASGMANFSAGAFGSMIN